MAKKKEQRKNLQGHESVSSLEHYLDTALNGNFDSTKPGINIPDELKIAMQRFIESERAAMGVSRAIRSRKFPIRKPDKAEADRVINLLQLRKSTSRASLTDRTS